MADTLHKLFNTEHTAYLHFLMVWGAQCQLECGFCAKTVPATTLEAVPATFAQHLRTCTACDTPEVRYEKQNLFIRAGWQKRMLTMLYLIFIS